MSWRSGRALVRVVVAVVMVALAALPSLDTVRFPTPPVDAAAATPGTLLKTIYLPKTAACGQGTSLAIISGRMLTDVGVPTTDIYSTYPVLLVTTCAGTGANPLSFVDPASPTAADPNTGATLVKSVPTSQTPASGWRSLALR